jgi:hypothetical protein
VGLGTRPVQTKLLYISKRLRSPGIDSINSLDVYKYGLSAGFLEQFMGVRNRLWHRVAVPARQAT